MADHSVSPRCAMLFSEVLPFTNKKKKNDAASLDLPDLTHLKKSRFFILF